MKPAITKFQDISDYIDTLSGEVGSRISELCRTIEEDVPMAEGRISYHMPAYFLNGSLVYFSAFKNHIGFYPASTLVFEEFREDLAPFRQSGRGTIQFQHSKQFPIELIRQMVAFRVQENLAKGEISI